MLFDVIYLILLLLSVLILVESRLSKLITYLTLQGLIQSTTIMQVRKVDFHFILLVILVILFKAILTPVAMRYVIKRTHTREDTHPRFGFFLIFAMLLAGILFASSVADSIQSRVQELDRVEIIYVLMVLYTGILIFITRHNWVALIAGLVVFENGIFLLTLMFNNGLPFRAELGTFVDALLAIVTAGILQIRPVSTEAPEERVM